MSPHFPIPVSLVDAADGKANLPDPAVLVDRMAKDLVGTGPALMAGLIKAAKDRCITMRRGARARHPVIENGVVIGLEAEWQAPRSVIHFQCR
jgi:3-oxosteroid 1-dehydrogenase